MIYLFLAFIFQQMYFPFIVISTAILAVSDAFSHKIPTITFVSAIWQDPDSPDFSKPSLLHSQLDRLLYIRQFLSMSAPLIVFGEPRILKLMQLPSTPVPSPSIIFIPRDILSLKHINDTVRQKQNYSKDKQDENLLLRILEPNYYRIARLGLLDKFFLLQEAQKRDIFHSELLVWLEADTASTFGWSMLSPVNQFTKAFTYWQSPWLFFKEENELGGKPWVRLDCFGGRKEALSTVISILQNWQKQVIQVKTSTFYSQQALLFSVVENYSYLFGSISRFNLTNLKNFSYYSPKLHLFEHLRHFRIHPNLTYEIDLDQQQTIVVVKQENTLTFSEMNVTYYRILQRKAQKSQRRLSFAVCIVFLFAINEVTIQIARKRWSLLADCFEEELS